MARILIIDDNQANLDLMVYLLKAFKHTTLAALSGEQGLATARRDKPDLIVCDVHMPDIDGYAVAGQIRADTELSHMPLIAVTALAMVGDRDKVLAAGFDGYISKPIDPETFVSVVETFLPSHRPFQGLAVAGSSATTAPTSAARPVILVVDDHPVNLMLERSMLEPMGYTVLSANGMAEALQVARQSLPALILSDVNMLEDSGFDFIKAVKADQHLADIPFVFITSTYHDEVSRRHGLSLGAARYLFRPLDPEVFLAEISACLHTKYNR